MLSEITINQKSKRLPRIRHLIILCLVLLFIWWGSGAILKYWSQPLTTDTSYIFGDNENGIQFPLITICSQDFSGQNQLMKDCKSGKHDFIGSIVSCMKANSNYQINSFLDGLRLDIRKLVAEVVIWTGSEHIHLLDGLDDQAWSMTFHYALGLCYTFDLSKIEKFKYISYQERMRPALAFLMAENNPWQKVFVMVHTRNDFPDALHLNGLLSLIFTTTKQEMHKIDLKKKINKREPTRKVPCSQHEYNTCQNIEDNQLVLDKFHCRLPILYSGQHLDNLISKEVVNCSRGVTIEALDFILTKKSKCKQTQTCEMTRFTSTYTVTESLAYNETLIWVAFANPEVQHQNTYVSYNLISLLGEVGGILGLTLGASTLTLLELFFQNLRYY